MKDLYGISSIETGLFIFEYMTTKGNNKKALFRSKTNAENVVRKYSLKFGVPLRVGYEVKKIADGEI